jgi:hypothetical protein
MPRLLALILLVPAIGGLLLSACAAPASPSTGAEVKSMPANPGTSTEVKTQPASPTMDNVVKSPPVVANASVQTQSAPVPTVVPVSALPKEVQIAPARVRAAYQFALSNPGALKNVPCYCGCGAMGHTSNLSCYIKERKTDGTVVYDDHALGCSICVDIAQDVMRMTGEGKSPAQVRDTIVSTYSQFGPANQ